MNNKPFKVGDIVAFNFTPVKTPMKIIKIRNKKFVELIHRDIGYDCGEIDIEYIEKWKKEYDKIQDVGVDLADEKSYTVDSVFDNQGNLIYQSRK